MYTVKLFSVSQEKKVKLFSHPDADGGILLALLRPTLRSPSTPSLPATPGLWRLIPSHLPPAAFSSSTPPLSLPTDRSRNRLFCGNVRKGLLLFSDRKQLFLLWSLSGCCVFLFRALKENLGCTADKFQHISCTADVGFQVPFKEKILVFMLLVRSIVSEIYITILSLVCKTGA
jgi:hypothetical protein